LGQIFFVVRRADGPDQLHDQRISSLKSERAASSFARADRATHAAISNPVPDVDSLLTTARLLKMTARSQAWLRPNWICFALLNRARKERGL